MKVRDLIHMLSNPDIQDLEVLLSADSEGNTFYRASSVSLDNFDNPRALLTRMNEDGSEAVVIWP